MKRTGEVCWRVIILLILVCVPATVGADGPPNAADAAAAATEDAYIVKKGDTLWGISKELLQDPLLWPRLWEQNRFIVDPNLIFPGDRLALPGAAVFGGTQFVPGRGR